MIIIIIITMIIISSIIKWTLSVTNNKSKNTYQETRTQKDTTPNQQQHLVSLN